VPCGIGREWLAIRRHEKDELKVQKRSMYVPNVDGRGSQFWGSRVEVGLAVIRIREPISERLSKHNPCVRLVNCDGLLKIWASMLT
jgi:hypothetical protein